MQPQQQQQQQEKHYSFIASECTAWTFLDLGMIFPSSSSSSSSPSSDDDDEIHSRRIYISLNLGEGPTSGFLAMWHSVCHGNLASLLFSPFSCSSSSSSCS
jgi:hypothetical protein